MNPGIQSLWIILTVIVPGLVFYGVFRVLVAVLGIHLPFFTELDTSEGLSVCVLFAIMFTLQILGITIESIAFKIGYYQHKKSKYQQAFNRRYEIIATLDPQKDYHVERILSQFYMSHNIAVGMAVNLCWVVIYAFFIHHRDNPAILPAVILLSGISLLSTYVAINRFSQSCQALYTHLHKLDEKL